MSNYFFYLLFIASISYLNSSQKENTFDSKLNKKINIENPILNQGNYQEYCNERYQFCIEYPSNFIPQGESSNLDGQEFLSKDGEVEIKAFGGLPNELINYTLQEELDIAIKNNNITYKIFRNNWFVISGFDADGKIFYRKTILKELDDYYGNGATRVYQTLMIIYPENRSNLYSSYCDIISKSFK